MVKIKKCYEDFVEMKRKQNKSIILRLVVLAFCVYSIITLTNLWVNLNEKQKELELYKVELNQRINDVDELKELLNSDSNTELIEKAARERLGYVYSNEQIFIDISGN